MFFDKLIVKILIIFLAWKFKLPLKAFILTWKMAENFSQLWFWIYSVTPGIIIRNGTFLHFLFTFAQKAPNFIYFHLKIVSKGGKPQQKQQNLIWNVFCLFYCGFKPPRVRKTNLPCQLVHFPRVLTKRSRGKAK